MQLILWALSSFLPAFMATRASVRFVISEAASLWSLSISTGRAVGICTLHDGIPSVRLTGCWIAPHLCLARFIRLESTYSSTLGIVPSSVYSFQFSGIPVSTHSPLSGFFDALYQQPSHVALHSHLVFIRASIVSSCSLSDGGSFDISRFIMSVSGS